MARSSRRVITHRYLLGSASDESAVSIAIAEEIVTPVGEFRSVPRIGAVPNKNIIDVEVGGTIRVAAAERHHA